jgi:hypothetical protein
VVFRAHRSGGRLREREKNPGEEGEHEGDDYENKDHGEPPGYEPESLGNTEIGTDQSKH